MFYQCSPLHTADAGHKVVKKHFGDHDGIMPLCLALSLTLESQIMNPALGCGQSGT